MYLKMHGTTMKYLYGLNDNGVINGYENTTFCQNNSVNRAEKIIKNIKIRLIYLKF